MHSTDSCGSLGETANGLQTAISQGDWMAIGRRLAALHRKRAAAACEGAAPSCSGGF